LFAYQSNTSSNYTLTVRTADGTGSGWAGADHPDWSKVDVKAVVQRAIDKARSSRNPVAIEPGRYTVILEPQAVGDLVQLLAFALDARSADEGRSAFSKQGGGTKIGEKVVDERVTLLSDPADPGLLSNTFDGQGLPARRQVWIDNGVLKKLTYSRFWAQKKSQEPDAGTNAVRLVGGTASLDDLIQSTPRGVLVTRLWYLRQVDPRTELYTGLTRDGTFLIENGKISRSVKNFRFNESPLFMLNNLETLGKEQADLFLYEEPLGTLRIASRAVVVQQVGVSLRRVCPSSTASVMRVFFRSHHTECHANRSIYAPTRRASSRGLTGFLI